MNKFGIPARLLESIRKRDAKCVYCHKEMISPYDPRNRADSATIEHLSFDGPFYWSQGLKVEDLAICCGSCNSSRGSKRLTAWFRSPYCSDSNISEDTVSKVVSEYLKRNPDK